MAKKTKLQHFSAKLVDGEMITGLLLQVTPSMGGPTQPYTEFKVEIEGLEFFIRDTMCMWYAIGKKPYSEIQKQRYAEMKQQATEIVKSLVGDKKKVAPVEERSSQSSGPIQPDGVPALDSEEGREAFDRINRSRSTSGSIQAIAAHQQRLHSPVRPAAARGTVTRSTSEDDDT